MIRISIIGPDHEGQPMIHMSAGGKYAPDVAHDIRNRADTTLVLEDVEPDADESLTDPNNEGGTE